jgi:hypothetical protein
VERLLGPYSITATTQLLKEKRRAFINFFSRLYNSFMISQAGDGTLSSVDGRPVMVFHTDGVRGGFPLVGARAARAVYTLERMATGSVPQRLCADDLVRL